MISFSLIELERLVALFYAAVPKDYFVLQRIYVSLDEPDGVAGVAAIRQEDPSLDEQVIQHVATGRMSNLSVT